MQGRLNRRTFLKGTGTALALPLLDAMHPATFAAAEAGTASTAPTRLAFVFFPNGVIQDAWKPAEIGRDYQLTKSLAPLAAHKNDFNVLTGLTQDNGRAKGDGAGDHARCAASFLTGAHPVKTDGADIRVGMSVDQVAAAEIGHRTPLPSLEIGIDRGRNAGNCDSGYSCAYSSNVSWKTPTTPMAKEINPRAVFERLFGDGARNRAQRDFYRQSILDLVSADARKLQQQLGRTDRRKVDEYFTSVRDLELRIERSAARKDTPVPDVDVPEERPEELADQIRLMYDLLALAFQTDTTRISTFMLANAGSNRSYQMVGVNEGHHELSHHGNDKEKTEKIQKIDQYLIEQFAYFLDKLKSIKEGEGTLLDHSLVLYGSGLGDGNRHTHHDLPLLLAGNASGRIQTGRHIAYPDDTPMNNLFMSLLDYSGAKVEKIGDSSGRLTGLEG